MTKVTRSHNSKKDKKMTKMKKDKMINNDQQNITHKTKDLVTRASLTTVGELRKEMFEDA